MGSRGRNVAAAFAAGALLAVGSAAGPVHAQTGTPTASPTATPTATASPSPELACDADYAIDADWGTGFSTEITLTNVGTVSVDDWQVRVTLPNGAYDTNGWNATFTQSGAVVEATPVGWNATIAPGVSMTFGFIGTGDGTPSGIGVRCSSPV